MDKDIKPQNLKFHCRTCLNHFSGLKYDLKDLPSSMFQLLKNATGNKKDTKELYPQSLCHQCYDTIKSYDDFQETAKKSAQFLENMLQSYIDELKDHSPESENNKLEETEFNLPGVEACPSNSENEDNFEDPLLQENDFSMQSEPADVEVKDEFSAMDVYVELAEEATNDFLDEKSSIEGAEQKSEEPEVSDKPRPEFKCDVCDKTYASTSSLYMHKRIHNTEHSFKCNICDRGFNKRYRLTHHLKQIHKIEAPTKQNKKNVEKSNESADDKPQSEANVPSEIKVKIEKINEKISELMTNEANEDFLNLSKICVICHKTFSSSGGLRSHMRTHEAPRFRCEKCGRGFNKKTRFTQHCEEMHSENPVEIVCEYGCGKTFKHIETAKGHYRKKHIQPAQNAAPKDYTRMCEICGKICKNISVLKEHHYQHVPLEETPYQCEQCKKRFRTKKHLQNHVMRHLGVKKFECPQCGLKKMSPHELRVHMNYHTKLIQHHCSVCNKAFTNPGNLRRHEQVVHQGIKKFNCRFCEESFGKAETLKHHEMRHTGERPHKCPHCERSFIQSVALKTHLKTHNKQPKFSDAHKLTGLDKIPEPMGLDATDPNGLLDVSGLHKLPSFSVPQKLTGLPDMPDSGSM